MIFYSEMIVPLFFVPSNEQHFTKIHYHSVLIFKRNWDFAFTAALVPKIFFVFLPMKYLGHDCVEIQVGFFCFTRNCGVLGRFHLEHKTLGPRHLWLYNFWDQMDQLFFSSEKTWFCETKSTFDQLLSHIMSLNFLLWTLNLSVWLLSKSHLKCSIYWFFCSLDFYLTADLPIPLSWFL